MKETSNTKTKNLATCAVLTALALIFSYVEVLIPISVGVPGIKLGLANIVVLLASYSMGFKEAGIINMARILISSFLFGNAFSIIYSIAGALISFIILVITKKAKIFSILGVSMAMGVFHNLGQITAAAFLLRTIEIVYYMPVLVISGTITGLVIGYLSFLILRAIKDVRK